MDALSFKQIAALADLGSSLAATDGLKMLETCLKERNLSVGRVARIVSVELCANEGLRIVLPKLRVEVLLASTSPTFPHFPFVFWFSFSDGRIVIDC